MGKTAFVFPGQGAQYPGMGKDFYQAFPVCREVFEKASRKTGIDVARLCFEESEKINRTRYTQIGILTVSAAILAALEEEKIVPHVSAGLSLGEYGALIASGALAQEDAFSLVCLRGRLMEEAVPTGGAMAAVLGLAKENVEAVCAEIGDEVSLANDNCPGQLVITGKAEAVALAGTRLREAGARRVLPLKVSGPFHSRFMEEAGQTFGRALENASLSDIRIPYLTNVTGDYVRDKSRIKGLLVRQISSPVLWRQSVERMAARGTTLFAEVGPGRTLTGFLKKIDPGLQGISIGTVEEFEKALPILRQEGRDYE